MEFTSIIRCVFFSEGPTFIRGHGACRYVKATGVDVPHKGDSLLALNKDYL